MDKELREAERYGGDIDTVSRRCGIPVFPLVIPDGRVGWPKCPMTGCTHYPGCWRDTKCYLYTSVPGKCAGPIVPIEDYLEDGDPIIYSWVQHDECPWEMNLAPEQRVNCLCPCHVTSYDEWIHRFMARFGPETKLPYAGML